MVKAIIISQSQACSATCFYGKGKKFPLIDKEQQFSLANNKMTMVKGFQEFGYDELMDVSGGDFSGGFGLGSPGINADIDLVHGTWGVSIKLGIVWGSYTGSLPSIPVMSSEKTYLNLAIMQNMQNHRERNMGNGSW